MNYNNSNSGMSIGNNFNSMNQNIPAYQFPYGTTNNMLLNNTPYNNYMGQQQQQSQNNIQFLKCRPVSSKDEARAFQIDLDGSLWVFTDLGSGKIYTKQINNDGTASFKTYQLTVEDENSYNSNDFVTKEEFNKTVQNLIAAIQVNNKEKESHEQLLNFNGG